MAKRKTKEYGFITLYSDGRGTFWFKVSRGFSTAFSQTLSSLEALIEEQNENLTASQKNEVNFLYRNLSGLYE